MTEEGEEPAAAAAASPCESLWARATHSFRFLYGTLGGRFLALTVLIEFVLQGFVFGGGGAGLVGVPVLFLLRQTRGMTGPRMQTLKTVALLPWSLKPLLGVLSDIVALGGYAKLPYMLGTTALGALAAFAIALGWPLHPVLFVGALTLLFLQLAFCDLLLEAKYAERRAAEPALDHYIVSFVARGTMLGALASILVTGLLVDRLARLADIYYAPALALALTLVPLYCNWIGDAPLAHTRAARPLRNLCCGAGWFTPLAPAPEPGAAEFALDDASASDSGCDCAAALVEPEPAAPRDAVATPLCGADTAKLAREWRTFVLALLIGAISLGVALMGLLDVPPLALMLCALGGALLMAAGFGALVHPVIAKVQCFVIAQNMFSVSLEGATFFFYTDDARAYPAGPHFSVLFYVTVMGVSGCLVGIAGTLLYDAIAAHWPYRRVFLVTNLACVVFALTNVAFFARLNVALGLPDWLFVLGADALQTLAGVWSAIPATTIMLGLCPPGLEATMYALLAGSANLGAALAQYQGVFLLEALGVRPSGAPGESAAFANLWIAALVAALLPLAPLALIPWLIPDAAPGDALVAPDEAAAAAEYATL